MTRPRISRNGFITVFAVAAIALVCAGTIVVTAEKSGPVRSNSNAGSDPSDHPPFLWNIG